MKIVPHFNLFQTLSFDEEIRYLAFSSLKKFCKQYIYCGCPRTDDEVEGLQHWYRNAPGHGPEEESCARKGKDKSKYSIRFRVGAGA